MNVAVTGVDAFGTDVATHLFLYAYLISRYASGLGRQCLEQSLV